jgi:hypothetical protein
MGTKGSLDQPLQGTESENPMKTRREFLATTVAAALLTNRSGKTMAALSRLSIGPETGRRDAESNDLNPGDRDMEAPDMTDKAEDPRITRARLSGPAHVTKDATVAELSADGTMTVLLKGTNQWVCTPGNENKIGDPAMCMNPMGMRWMMDAMQGKPKPTNTAPGMIYMLCGAAQGSNPNPADRTSPAIPIGPHWMITWPFDAAENGLPATVRDKGAWVMFAGTPYAYLHVSGSLSEGNEYHEGDKAVWTMSQERRRHRQVPR